MDIRVEMANSLEGRLFLAVYICQLRGSLMICRDRYTVLGGVVHEIKNGRATPTRDKIESVASLKPIGVFEPEADYENIPAIILPVEDFVRAIEREESRV